MSSLGKHRLACSLKDGPASVNQTGPGKSITRNRLTCAEAPPHGEEEVYIKIVPRKHPTQFPAMVIVNNANDDASGSNGDGDDGDERVWR